ncbi:MAG: radical SAM protein [Bacillota bacterium]
MHYTLHLTNNCNMACDYCYVNNSEICTISFDTAKKAVDLICMKNEENAGSSGIIFFGGEPLIEKDLIHDTVDYCRRKGKETGRLFHFKITTNGLLLDEQFMKYANDNGILVALSHDGIREAHNMHRKDKSGEGTFDSLSAKIDMVLSYQPYAPVLMVVNPDTVEFYAESVMYLYEKGFKYIICSLNYAGKWNEETLGILEKQYQELAEFYYEKTLLEDKFYLSPFEVKISSHINRESYCRERCELGKKQVSVGPDGKLYPCVQFVGDENYSIGNVDDGLDENRRNMIYRMNEKEKAECADCAVKDRCNHHCGCLNKQATGYINRVSPVLCAHERILLPIADSLAERLFKKRSALFIQKHYNDMYPLVSLIEDKLKL